MTSIPDFRPHLAAAQGWVAGLMSNVRAEQMDDPTPCTEYDVRALLRHISSNPAKLAAIAAGEDPRALADQADIDEQRLADDYATRSAAALDAWSDDALLTQTLIAPWGEAPGGMSVAGFVMETITHGWDLAVATGQDAEADPELVAMAQSIADQALTDEFRGSGFPFGHRVDPADDAGPTERLANFLGRQRP